MESYYTELAKLMIKTNKRHKKAFDDIVVETGLTRNAHFALAYIERGGKFSSQKELAYLLGITPAAVTLLLGKLEKMGYIERKTAADSRYNEIFLTECGMEIIKRSRERFMAIDEKMFFGFSDNDLSSLKMLLEKMNNNLNSIEEGDDK